MKILVIDENLLSKEERVAGFIKLGSHGALKWIGDEEAYYAYYLKKNHTHEIQERFGNTVKYLRAIIDAQNAYVCILHEGEVIDGNQQFLQRFTYGDIQELFQGVQEFKKVNVEGEKTDYQPQDIQEWMNALMQERDYLYWIRFQGDPAEQFYEVHVHGTHYHSGVDAETYEQHNYLIMHLRDVSIQIGMENAIRKRDAMISQQAKVAALGETISNIAHHWRQPLNHLGLILQQVERFSEDNTLSREKVCTLVSKGMATIEHLSSKIDQFKSFFRPMGQAQWYDITQIIQKTVETVWNDFAKEGVVIEMKLDGVCEIWGYSNELSQILLNLLNNARDALLETHPWERTIWVSSRCEEETVFIEVQDNAGGVPHTVFSKIFDPYFSTKGVGRGEGNGLYLSKMLIEEHMGGKLEISNEKEGALLRICLPKTYQKDFDNEA